MDSGTIITALIVIFISILPFVIVNISNRKRKKQYLKRLLALAEKNNCKISQHDLWSNSAIGIDETSNMIFFTRKVNDNETAQQVNLAEIQKCRVSNSGRTISINDNSNVKVIDTLELAFTNEDKSKEEALLEFYNKNYDSLHLSGELLLAEKWCKIANDSIGAAAQK